MLRYERRLEAVDQPREPRHLLFVGRFRPRERQTDAMERQRMTRANAIEPLQPRSAVDHVILRMYFEPETVGDAPLGVGEVLGFESDTRRHRKTARRVPAHHCQL